MIQNNRLIVLEHITLRANRFMGTSHAFMLGLAVIAIWALSFLFNRPSWHAAIVEVTAILSFVNIFITQRAQNKDLKAIHIKLDELIASSSKASNLLIKAEEAPEQILEQVEDIYKSMAKVSLEEPSRTSITSAAIEHIMEAVHSDIAYQEIIADQID